jgi:hypothetical protein
VVAATNLFFDVVKLAALQLAVLEDNRLLGYFDKIVCFSISIVAATGYPGLVKRHSKVHRSGSQKRKGLCGSRANVNGLSNQK